MREMLGKSIKAKQGDILVVDCRFPGSTRHQAKVEIFSGVKGYELSPHVPDQMASLLEQGKPMMLTPVRVVLHSERQKYQFVIPVSEDLIFAIMQDKDVKGDPSAKIKVKKYGKYLQAFGRFLRKFSWRIGSRYDPYPWLT